MTLSQSKYLDSIPYLLYTLQYKVYITKGIETMQTVCIACNSRFFYVEGDQDCTRFVCSYCIALDPQKGLSKWARLRFRILNRDEFTCRYCGNSPTKDKLCTLHIDHIDSQSKVTNNSEKNLITACAICNYGKLNFELTDKSKERINEYLNSSEVKLDEYSKTAKR